MENTREQTTAIYCRVACKDDNALANQELMLRRYAEENGYENITVYADNGYSGLNYDRPAFKQMQTDIKSGIVGAVLVKDIARITRNCFDFPEWVFNHQHDKAGVKFISMMNGSGMFADLQKDFHEALTAMCKRIHSEKTKKGLARKKILAH